MHLLPKSGLSIIAEKFLRVEHCLLAPPGASLATIKRIHSHPVALGQVRNLLSELGATPVVEYDTAGSAEIVAKLNNVGDAAVASSLAAELHGLQILRRNVEDAAHNTTRFYVMAKTPAAPAPGTPHLMTTFLFRVRNVPAALYKALGGFATNGVNMTKLESYMVNGTFTATQFLAEVEGHPEERPLRLALEELEFFSTEIKILGTYPADPFRLAQSGTLKQGKRFFFGKKKQKTFLNWAVLVSARQPGPPLFSKKRPFSCRVLAYQAARRPKSARAAHRLYQPWFADGGFAGRSRAVFPGIAWHLLSPPARGAGGLLALGDGSADDVRPARQSGGA